MVISIIITFLGNRRVISDVTSWSTLICITAKTIALGPTTKTFGCYGSVTFAFGTTLAFSINAILIYVTLIGATFTCHIMTNNIISAINNILKGIVIGTLLFNEWQFIDSLRNPIG
jgi:hypothetical protein